MQIPQQTITIEGDTYDSKFFKDALKEMPVDSFRKDLFLFLQDWFSGSPYLKVKTSGSTGTPKEMLVEKERMMQSARLTCSFLNLKKGDKALLCMSLDYIAGKMMVVRALLAGLDLYLVEPKGNPLQDTDIPFDFAAMIPMQVYNSLQSDVEKKRLSEIKNLIIGGGSIDEGLENALKHFPHNIYSTYGMTETLSHIAMRRLSGIDVSAFYSPLPSVSLSLSEDNALIIDAPLVAKETLCTNDIAEMRDDGSFRIIGRKDNVINSGGIKIQIEVVEAMLKPHLDCNFAISSLPDPKFGEIVVLVAEEAIDTDLLKEVLPAYYMPKRIITVASIPLTATGKISRKELKELIG